MRSVLEVTGEDIQSLNDTRLRDLIGLLCEADYRRASISVAGISWGGNQDAGDGGFDVLVSSISGSTS